MRNILAWALTVSFSALAILGMGQRPPIGYSSVIDAAIHGEFGPASMTINELPDDMKAVELSLTGLSSMQDLYGGAMEMMGQGDPSIPAKERGHLSGYLTCYWTTGKTVPDGAGGGPRYLVTYRMDSPVSRATAYYGNGGPAFAGFFAEPTLRLRLINISQIVSLTPRPDLSKADWLKMAADLGAATKVGGGSQQAAVSNAKQLALGALIYTNDYDDLYPNAHSIAQAKKEIMPYVKNAEIFLSQNPNGGQILFNVNLAAVNAESILSPSTAPLFYDSRAWPDGGRPVAFADGHAKYVTAEEWERVAAELARKYRRKPAAPPPKAGGKPKGKKR